MRFRQVVLGVVVALSMMSRALAEGAISETIDDVLQNVKSDSAVEAFLIGAARGFEAANYRMTAVGEPLFCPPKKVGITSDQWMEIMRAFVKEYPHVGKLKAESFAVVIGEAMIDAFPCSN